MTSVEDADRVAAGHHDDVIVLQVFDGVLEHLPFADLLVEFGVGHSQCRAPLLGNLPGRKCPVANEKSFFFVKILLPTTIQICYNNSNMAYKYARYIFS